VHTNDAGIPKAPVHSNDAGIAKASIATNDAGIPKENVNTNRATLDSASIADNQQEIDNPAMRDNMVAIAKNPHEENLQALDKERFEDRGAGVTKKPIADHFEKLPGNNASAARAMGTAVKPSTPLAKKQKNASSRAVSPAEAQRLAQLHQAQMEAFHGRLAGIKHNVDELNHKLDEFENKN
jgi:hypothetical protein